MGLGFGGDKARELTEGMQALALDFAAFHNLADDEAMGRFISAMSGSSEVLDQFGINTKAAAINQKLLEMGIHKTTANATEQEKTMARLAIIAESMGSQGAIGAAARESDSFANKSKALNAKLEKLAETIGEQLLPRVLELTQKGIDVADAVNKWAAENPELAKTLGDVALGLVAAGGAIGGLGISLGLLTPLLNPATLLVGGLAVAVYDFGTALRDAADDSKTLEERLMAVVEWAMPLVGILQKLELLDGKILSRGIVLPAPVASAEAPAAALDPLPSHRVNRPSMVTPSPAAAGPVASSLLGQAGANIWDEMRRDWLTMQAEQEHRRFQEQRTIEDEIAREKIMAIEDQSQRE